MPTATFSGDFDDFYKACSKAETSLKLVQKETDKTSAATEGMAETFTVSAGEVNKTSTQFSQFNDILGAVGIHLGPIPKAMDEIGAASGKTAGQLGALATAGLAVGAAVAGWKVGRMIADFTGSDKIIGDAVAGLLGWKDAAGGAGSATDTLARATEAAKRPITDFNEALRELRKGIDETQTTFARARAPEESAKLVAGYHQTLENLRKSGVLDDLKRALEANIIPQKTLMDLYRISAPALKILTDQLAVHKERVDRINEANQKQVDLQNQLFGRELTAKAQEYAAAIGDISNVSKLLPDQMKTVNETFVAAATHLAAIGLGASEAAQHFRELAVATTDWSAVNKAVAASPDPFVAANEKRRAAFRETLNDQLNLNQGVFDGAAEWMHAGEIADKAMADAAAGTKETTQAVTEQIGQVNALAGSFAIVSRSASEYRAMAAQLYQDASRNERTQGGVTIGWSPFQYAQNQRSSADQYMAMAGRQDQLSSAIASREAPWTRNNAGMTITVNAMQGIDGDQIAGALVTGMRQRGIGLGGLIVRQARLAYFRLNDSRLYYVAIPKPVTGVRLLIGGVWISYAGEALVDGASVTQALNEAPDTATIRFRGTIDQPLLGQGVAITQNNPYGEEWVFSGHILAVRTVYEGRAQNVVYECDCIDYTWTLNFRKVSRRYVGQSAGAIITDLVARYAPPSPPGFAVAIAAEVPATPLDEITFTNEELASAISRVCERLGLYWLVDYLGIVRVFTSSALGSAGTITQTNARTASVLKQHRDLSSVATIISARGGGSTASVDVPAGSTTLPVDDPAWYALGGGYVECGPQVIGYLGVSNPRTGAIVGTGNAPTAAPTVGAASGTNLTLGATYQYAVSFVTASGETLPGPLTTYVPVGTTIAPAPPPQPGADIRDSGSPSYGQNKMVPGGSYRWAWQKYLAGGGLVPGTPGPAVVVNSNNWQIRIPAELYDGTVTGLTPFRTANGGSVFYADHGTMTGSPGSGAGWFSTGLSPDGDLVQFPPMGSSGAGLLAAALSQIPTRDAGATGRKLYRTAANGTQLKLLTTLANNTATTFIDTVTDAALGANAPTTDTSGIQSSGQVNAGAAAILVSNAKVFDAGGGWVQVSGVTIRYTGVSGSSLVLAVPLGSTLSYGSEIFNAPHLTGIPSSGAWSIVYPIKGGDEVYVFVNRWDDTAIQNLAAWIGYGDGQRYEFLTDGRLSLAELTTRADAMLAYRKDPLVTVTFETRDPAVSVGKTITFNTTAPPIVGTFLVQRVGIDQFPAAAHVKPVAARRVVEASSRRYTFDDLVQQIKLLGRIN